MFGNSTSDYPRQEMGTRNWTQAHLRRKVYKGQRLPNIRTHVGLTCSERLRRQFIEYLNWLLIPEHWLSLLLLTQHIPDETAGARRCTSPPLAGAVQLPPGGPEFLAELLGYKKLTRSSNVSIKPLLLSFFLSVWGPGAHQVLRQPCLSLDFPARKSFLRMSWNVPLWTSFSDHT